MVTWGGNVDADINGHPDVLHEGRDIDVCVVPSKDVDLEGHMPVLGVFVDIKGPIMSLENGRRVIAGP